MKVQGFNFDCAIKPGWHPILKINDERRFTRRSEMARIGLWFLWRAVFPRRIVS